MKSNILKKLNIYKPIKAFSIIEISVVIIIIIGLVSLINFSQKLISENKIESAIKANKKSQIIAIKSLIGWFETTDHQSLKLDEKEDFYPIEQWFNLNGNIDFKLKFIQKNLNLAPSYILSSINNLPSIEFNGVNSFFRIDSEQDLNLKEFSIFIINSIKNFSPSDQSTLFASCNDDQKFLINTFRNRTKPDYQLLINHKTQIIDKPFNLENKEFNQANILNITVNPAAINTYINGLNILNLTNNLNTKLFNKTFIGANDCDNPTTNFFLGHVSEILIFNQELSDEDRHFVEKYLANKWAIKLENPQL